MPPMWPTRPCLRARWRTARSIRRWRHCPPRASCSPGAVVATKLDMGLLVELARARPSWSFALVGPVGLGDPSTDVSALVAEPNLHLLGARTYEQLPSVLRGADAGLIPYARNQLTDSIFPMKVYEYLAAGLPVVATPLPSLSGDRRLWRARRMRMASRDCWTRRLPRTPPSVVPSARKQQPPTRGRSALSKSPPRSTLCRKTARDLLVTTHTPALRSGRDVRTYGIARALAMNGPVTLLYVRFGADRPDEAFSSIPGIELQEVIASRGGRRAIAYVKARLSGVPSGLARGVSPELASAAAQLASSSRLPARDRRRTDSRGRARGPGTSASSHLQRTQPGVGFPPRAARRGRFAARLAFVRAATVEAVERVVDGQRGRHAWRARTVPGGKATACAQCRRRLGDSPCLRDAPRPDPDRRPSAGDVRAGTGFIRTREDPHNRAGGDLRRQLRLHAKPQRAGVPAWASSPARVGADARRQLLLAGAGLEHPPSEDPRVRALGFVEDLAGAYAQARCAVVPLLQGGGSPLKLVEALAYGLPVVATPRAVAGLDVRGRRGLPGRGATRKLLPTRLCMCCETGPRRSPVPGAGLPSSVIRSRHWRGCFSR